VIYQEKMIIPLQAIEYFKPPEELNGQYGRNRSDTKQKLIDADTDLDAIHSWLNEFIDSPQTYRNYRKEAERLLLWSLIEREKPFSSLNRDDFLAYEHFISDPQPKSRWCGPRVARNKETWKPFIGSLKASSQHQALIICQALLSYLVEAGYLAANPLVLRRRKRKTPVSQESTERFLEQSLWQYLLDFIDTLPKHTSREIAHYERNRYLFSLLYLLGPRVSEVANHTMGSFIEQRGRWWWRVTGKGDKTVKIPVNDDMLEALSRYRQYYGFSARPNPDEKIPLIMSIKGSGSITANMIYRIVKQTVNAASDELQHRDPINAEKLKQASTHWFRHTAITHQADAGIELRYLNKSARHEKIDTTAGYLHADEEQWHNAMQKHNLNYKIK